MQFRPCIDLHQGKVKQIVGETLNTGEKPIIENFVSEQGSAHYADLFRRDELRGGHVIMLGGGNEQAAVEALRAYPGGLQIGGGITADNAAHYLEQGATHIIVTSYLFEGGELNERNLQRLVSEVGKDRIVIDLSCKAKDDGWYVVTKQWTVFSSFSVDEQHLSQLADYCDEYLIHAVDVEGKRSGVQQDLARSLAEWVTIPTTYAGGCRSLEDLEHFRQLTAGKLDITIGSALDIFGGELSYDEVVAYNRRLA
ncbi:phosphoribosylformimino-5-aminoimidazole carboxamide ribotide isomerase [Paenibacillus daejeonensis]|uniref:phosphoribosylformimino-5-aminoimidazole carboxamide ribotide isomerase n=1 Tax=Paenibacillus daejeonensis TaxID=135193 RepID=UPI00035D998B|nr:phosphoribosylformimino-5-aminoimidazole carboxamide ribotide isomerase [Paenibacillus daejeonensis]